MPTRRTRTPQPLTSVHEIITRLQLCDPLVAGEHHTLSAGDFASAPMHHTSGAAAHVVAGWDHTAHATRRSHAEESFPGFRRRPAHLAAAGRSTERTKRLRIEANILAAR
jgi:hypothetical protein